MLAAVGVVVVGVICLVSWLLSMRHPMSDDTFRVGARKDRLRLDRDSLAASLERRLEPLDRRVDTSVEISRRGRVDLRVVTPRRHDCRVLDHSRFGPSDHFEPLAVQRCMPVGNGKASVRSITAKRPG